ncbi:MAG: RNA-binding transcriptional accessory protein, partial [Spirochaetales bacterium]|nr:RNA-binding transcriptional accessory protein [Spirochaetales bacterium]
MSLSLSQEFIDSLSVNTDDIISRISTALNLPLRGTEAVVRLLKEGNTIPFISRYRKEATGSLDEVQVRDISHTLINLENLEERRIEIIKAIFAQGKLTDEIYINIQKCTTYTELEDLYAPYKQKKKTRGMKAIERGLEPLADMICTQKDVSAEIPKFINPENEINNEKDAVTGAMDIIAERIAHDTDNRKRIKQALLDSARIVIKGNKDADTSVYKMYYDYDEPLKTLKEHRVLAINRGENEGELDVKIDYDEDVINNVVLDRTRVMNEFHQSGIIDGLRRLLIPAVIREIRSDFTEAADKHGIGVFAENLKNLL